ncbi:MAG TPA: O-antigen ligase family protein [Actinomycetota bacterium]|nr:O-antigen ligase family protein [Actinomycetota bacterium]
MAGPPGSRQGFSARRRGAHSFPTDDRTATRLTFGLVATATVLATVSGLAGPNKLMFVLPLAAGVALALAVLAISRFEAYVFVLLAARASLDLAKLSTETGGGALARILDPAGLLGIQFLVLAIFWLAAQHRAEVLEPPSAPARALLVFVAACVVSLVSTRDLLASSVEVSRILTAVVMFVVLEQMMTDAGSLRRLLTAVFASALFPLLFTAFGFLTGNPRTEGKGGFLRILGPFNQSNTFGRYLMLITIFGAALWPHLNRVHRRWMGGILAGSAVFLPLTYTRSAVVGTALGLLVVGLLQSRKLLAGLLLACALTVALVPQFGSRFSQLAEPSTSSLQNEGNSLRWRLDYWSEVVSLARRSPVWGIGLGETQRSTDEEKQPHNDLLRAFVETGVIGLAAYLISAAALMRLAYIALRRTAAVKDGPSLVRGVAVGFAGCVTAFLSVSLVANVITNVVNLWYFLTFAAGASYVARNKEIAKSWRSATTST